MFRKHAKKALSLLALSERKPRTTALSSLGLAYLNEGNLPRAEIILQETIEEIDSQIEPQKALMFLAKYADSIARQGRLSEAIHHYQNALTLTKTFRGHLAAMGSFACLGLGNVWYETNRLQKAEEAFLQAEILAKQWHPSEIPEVISLANHGLARIQWTKKHWKNTKDFLQQAKHHAPRSHPEIQGILDAFSLEITTNVPDIYSSHFISPKTKWKTFCLLPQALLFTTIKYYLRQEKTQNPAILSKLCSLLLSKRKKAKTYLEINTYLETSLLLSRLYSQLDLQQKAIQTLKQTLSYGMNGPYIRTFLDQGPVIAPLLTQCAKQKMLPEEERYYLHKISSLLDQQIPKTSTIASGKEKFSNILSKREIEILLLVSKGMSNRDIAQTLCLAEGTVKRHLSNIYGKLEVKNRTSAIEKARNLEFL